jgi:transcriptional regulator with XRE-family HTH domain
MSAFLRIRGGDAHMSGLRSILGQFHSREYREAYTDEFLNAWIATQIRALREQRSMTQADLAQKAGMKQSRISALENINYSSWSVSTLQRLAKAFDLTLSVEFKSYGKRVDDLERFERRDLAEPGFAEDAGFQTLLSQSSFLSSSDRLELGGNMALLSQPGHYGVIMPNVSVSGNMSISATVLFPERGQANSLTQPRTDQTGAMPLAEVLGGKRSREAA